MSTPAEEAFFFPSDGNWLYGVLHAPRAEQSLSHGVVFCHAFAEEQTLSHHVLVEFARDLARRGYLVLRFDYRGCGDSQGEFEEATLQTRLDDIASALGALRQRLGGGVVSLLGLRLGATLAALAAEADSNLESLVLWEPIVSGAAYFDQFLRMQVMAGTPPAGEPRQTREGLTADMAAGRPVDVLGFALSPECFDEFRQVELPERVGGFTGPVLVAALNKRLRERREFTELQTAYASRGGDCKVVSVAEHNFWIDPNDPFREMQSWQGHETLFAETADWLSSARQGVRR